MKRRSQGELLEVDAEGRRAAEVRRRAGGGGARGCKAAGARAPANSDQNGGNERMRAQVLEELLSSSARATGTWRGGGAGTPVPSGNEAGRAGRPGLAGRRGDGAWLRAPWEARRGRRRRTMGRGDRARRGSVLSLPASGGARRRTKGESWGSRDGIGRARVIGLGGLAGLMGRPGHRL